MPKVDVNPGCKAMFLGKVGAPGMSSGILTVVYVCVFRCAGVCWTIFRNLDCRRGVFSLAPFGLSQRIEERFKFRASLRDCRSDCGGKRNVSDRLRSNTRCKNHVYSAKQGTLISGGACLRLLQSTHRKSLRKFVSGTLTCSFRTRSAFLAFFWSGASLRSPKPQEYGWLQRDRLGFSQASNVRVGAEGS
jgi:hypothetical protein